MKIARIGLSAGLAVLLVGALGALIIWPNQARLVRLVLARVQTRTGVRIVSADATMRFGSHLIVTLDRPRLEIAGREIGHASRARLLVSYHAIIFNGGLPLFSLILESPRMRSPAGLGGRSLTFAPALPLLPRIDASLAAAIAQAGATVSSFARRIEIEAGTIGDQDAPLLIEDLNLIAARRRRLPSPLRLRFSATAVDRSRGQFKLRADIGVFPGETPRDVTARGWFKVWDFPLEIPVGRMGLDGVLRANLVAELSRSGRVAGRISAASPELVLRRGGQNSAVTLQNYSVQVSFDASPDGIELANVELHRGSETIGAGECLVDRPYEANPSMALQFATTEIDVEKLMTAVGADALPAFANELALLGSARVAIDQFSLRAPLNDLVAPKVSLLERIALEARVSSLEFRMPRELDLPPVSDAAAKITYANGRLTVLQGTARFGPSAISDIAARVDFSNHFDLALYQLSADGELDLGSLYPVLTRLVPASSRVLDKVREIEGQAGFEANAKGKIERLNLEVPDNYLVKLSPHRLQLSLATGKESAALRGGSVVVTPGLGEFDDLRVALGRGDAVLKGGLRFTANDVYPQQLSVRLQRVPAEGWLPLLIDPQDIGVRGLVDGSVVLDRVLSESNRYAIKGELTVGPGQFDFGFLRAPLLIQSAEARFDGPGVVLSLPAANIEGAPIDFTLSVRDFAKPVLRIDAVAQKLDLEAMKFVRLPWAAGAPANFFGNAAAEGHVEIRQANLSKLRLLRLQADFVHKAGDWRVYNLGASALGGRIALELSGRAKDEWLRMKGHVSGVDAASLFRLSGARPPVTDKFYADFDIWADTKLDFFETSGGKASIVLKDGSLRKFTLLSRVLGLIDLKNWLTAQVPDPRISGVPFRFVTADFAGSNGLFYTNNLVLDGPVLDITAQGSVNVADDSADMELGLLPFQTVDWLVNKIPLVGKEISQGSVGILAAYFRVRGPIRDPSVVPEPLTSAAEIVKKTLGLPLNILRPNTVK